MATSQVSINDKDYLILDGTNSIKDDNDSIEISQEDYGDEINLGLNPLVRGSQNSELTEELQHQYELDTSGISIKYVSDKSSRTLGTFAGVFCPVSMAMFSTLLFLRLGFVLGQAGLIQSLLMLLLAYSIMCLTILSVCAISTNGAIEGGGAYFMISRALGPEFGGGIGLLFFLAQVVSCALYTSGLVEALTVNFGIGGTLIGPNHTGLPLSYWWSYLYSTIVLLLCLTISLVGGHLYAKTNVFTFGVVMICSISVLISMMVKKGMCVDLPGGGSITNQTDHNKTYPHNHTSPVYPNCTKPFSASYTGFNKMTFLDNIYSNYQIDYSTGLSMNFAVVFSVLFSSVTGIMNGANMSGELKNPSKSIPLGTIAAAFFALSTFVLVLFFCSASSTSLLLAANYNFMLSVNLWPPFVAIGLFAATLSAALGNLIGGSRILLALAKDEIYGIFLRLAAKTTKGGNPIVAVFITWFLTQLVLLIGSLNNIAPMCSEMFLLAYAMTNLACLSLDLTSAPNFRPLFKYFSWHTAALGMLGCIVMCFVINYLYALISISILFILVLSLHMRGFETRWGSVSQALIFHQVRKYLLLLDSRKDHIKFWRPHILLMVSNPLTSARLIEFVNDLKKSGLYIIGHVVLDNKQNQESNKVFSIGINKIFDNDNLVKDIIDQSNQSNNSINEINKIITEKFNIESSKKSKYENLNSLKSNNIQAHGNSEYFADPLIENQKAWMEIVENLHVKAFVELTAECSVRKGMQHLIRLSGLGGMKPNTVCFGFYDEAVPRNIFNNQNVLQKEKKAFKKSFMRKKYGTADENTKQFKRLNDSQNTASNVIPPISQINASNYSPFANCEIESMNIVAEEITTTNTDTNDFYQGKALIEHFPIREPELSKPFSAISYVQMLQDALHLQKNLIIFRHFQNMDKSFIKTSPRRMNLDVWPMNFFNLKSTSARFDETCLFLLQMACILRMVSDWKNCTTLRIFACSQGNIGAKEKMKNQLAEFLKLLRIGGNIEVVEIDSLLDHLRISSDLNGERGPVYSDSYPVKINEMLRQNCSNTAVTFLYLPKPPDCKSLNFSKIVSDEFVANNEPSSSSSNRKSSTINSLSPDQKELRITKYLRQLDLMTQDMPPTVLVHGLQPVVCTSL